FCNVAGTGGEIAKDIRRGIAGGDHGAVLRDRRNRSSDGQGISGHSRENAAQLPTLDKPLDESGRPAEELPVRSEGQFPDTVGLQGMRSVESQQRMVQVSIVGVAILHKVIAVIFPESL